MSTTTTYGYVIPQSPDKGDTFFPALEANWSRVDQHKHDGISSPKIPPENLTRTTQTISAASWVDQGGGTYRYTVAMPGSLLFDNAIMRFVIATGSDAGAQIFPSIKKVTLNTFYIYINDNTVDVTVVYG